MISNDVLTAFRPDRLTELLQLLCHVFIKYTKIGIYIHIYKIKIV